MPELIAMSPQRASLGLFEKLRVWVFWHFEGAGVKVWFVTGGGLWFRASGFGFRVSGVGFGVSDLRFKGQAYGFLYSTRVSRLCWWVCPCRGARVGGLCLACGLELR